ncbi:MAG: trigger factor [Candidatus Eisenbacteria sp.]|nr:trigger factor [Candidatus Eisenbacteria bacterium]
MMKVEIEESGGTKRKLRIEVPASEVDEQLKNELVRLQRDLKMPGFRKGKVPTDLVRKKFSEAARREVTERIVREACMNALREHDLKPIAAPEIHDLEFKEGQPLCFRAIVEVWPDIELNQYKGLKATREVAAVAEEDVNRRLEMLRQMRAELVPVDRAAANGDFLIVDYDVFGDDDQPMEGRGVRNHMIELGSEGLVNGFSEGLMGAKVGDNPTIRVSFPEEEGVHPDVAGKTLKFWVKVNAVKEKQLSELNDDFAKELGNYDRLEDVRRDIRTGLEQEISFEADRRVREILVDDVIRANPFEAPESMVGNLLEAIVRDAEREHQSGEAFDAEKARAALKPVAVRHSKRFVVLREVAKRESLVVTPEEVDARIMVLAKQARQSPDEVRKKIETDDSMDQLRGDLLEEKVLRFLMEQADVENVYGQQTGGEK